MSAEATPFPGFLCCFPLACGILSLHTVCRKHRAVANWEYLGHCCRLSKGYCCSLGRQTGRAAASAAVECGRGVV